MVKKNKIKGFVRRWENSWIFWAIFLMGGIAVLSMFMARDFNARILLAGYMLFPLGLIMLIPPLRDIVGGLIGSTIGTIIYDLFYYGILGFIISKIVRDKRFNTKLILLLFGILLLTFIGCVAGGTF